jgi:hypothetical protein
MAVGLLLAISVPVVSSLTLACGASAGVRAVQAGIKGTRAVSRGAKGINTAGKLGDARQATRTVPMPVVPAEGLGLEGLGKIDDAVDVASLGLDGYDVAVTLFESDVPPPSQVLVGRATPRFVDLTSDSWPWRRLRDGQEHGRSPWIVVGRPAGDGLIVDGEAVLLSKLAATCWSTGTTCVFVACEFGCVDATQGLFKNLEGPFSKSVGGFTSQFVEARLALASGASGPAPVFVAVAGGVAGNGIQLLRPSPE